MFATYAAWGRRMYDTVHAIYVRTVQDFRLLLLEHVSSLSLLKYGIRFT